MSCLEASNRVLFENEQVELVKMATVKERLEVDKKRAQSKPKRQRVRDELFEVLRKLRKSLAQERGIPPYRVFSDFLCHLVCFDPVQI